MAISKRNRAKGLASAQKLLPDARATAYVIGRSGANPTLIVLAMIGGVVALTGLMLVALHTFVVPGVLPVLILQHFISPPRAIVVADQGVALAQRSIWTGRANKLVTVMGSEYVQPVDHALGRTCLAVGHERVWVAKNEEAVLRAALAAQQSGFAPPA